MYQRMSGAIDADYVPVMSDPAPEPAPAAGSPPLSASLKGLLSRLGGADLKSDDLLLAVILYFALRDSGDTDLLWIAAALFLSGAF